MGKDDCEKTDYSSPIRARSSQNDLTLLPHADEHTGTNGLAELLSVSLGIILRAFVIGCSDGLYELFG